MGTTKLAEIEARANAATPGPWAAMPLHRESDYPATNYFAEQRDVCGDASDGGPVAVACEAYFANAAFIAAARTDVPALVAEVRRLTAVLDAVTTERDALLAVCERFAGDEGVICNGYEDDFGCGSCGANANHSDADPANHAPDCARLAARALAAKIRALPLDAPGGGS